MTSTIAVCILTCFALLVSVLAAASPGVISDHNAFLRGFVNHEFLNVLGVIVAITLASAAQLHLALNSIEDRVQRRNIFIRTRAKVRMAAYALITLFVAGLALVVIKPLVALEPWSEALANGFALFILLWNVLILISLTEGVFSISSQVHELD